ncbi:MAG: septal ring lytic transglycosylase RlpA family protein [Deltaproteobacteria bacterium]|nr:septal ring lytic transglycosylase RlpA family protein [Deltaproteobacteria bacterium]
MKQIRPALALVLLVAIPGCAAHETPLPPPASPPPIANASPQAAKPAVHVVKASYYGSEVAGRPTTSGERFDPNRLTAASKTLPLGSVVKVENPKNGHSVTVRINDCGPFVRDRSLDLSRKAAQKIGITHQGVAPVRLTTLQTRPNAARCFP